MILPFDETGHFTCSQKRTFSLANDTAGMAADGMAAIHPESLLVRTWSRFFKNPGVAFTISRY